MDRRSVLASLGSAGALGVGGYLLTTTPSGPETDERRVTLDSVDSVPEDHQFRVEVELLESRITPAHTARVAITATNEGSKREISIGTARCGILNRHRGFSIPRGVFLWLPDRAEHFERDGDRWTPANSPGIGFGNYSCPSTVFDMGDSIRTEYELWDDHTEAGYLPPNTYRWEKQIYFFPDSDTPGSQAPTFTLGFSLSVELPD